MEIMQRVKAALRPGRSRRRGATARALAEALEPRQMMARVAGIDVSHYQGTGINWTSVKNAGYQFAWTKATEGLTYNDDTFTTNMTNAKGKVLIGSYHFARYDNQKGTAGASQEENHYWNVIKGYYTTANAGFYLAPMLDLENAGGVSPGGAGYTKATFSQWALRFLNDLKADLQSVGINLTPVIYTGASFAGSWLDSTVSASFPLWMANYNGLSRDTGSPFLNGSGNSVYGSPWQTPNGWQFWQYTSSQSVSGAGSIDADVFIGDIYSLISDYVIGGAPRWAVNERVTTSGSVTVWSTGAATTSIGSRPAGSGATVINSVPVYGNSFWRWQVRFDDNTVGWVGEDFLDTVAPGAASAPSPANSAATWLTSLPVNYGWSAGSNASNYDVYLDSTKKANVTTTSWAHPAVTDGTHTWRVDARNSELVTTGPTWTFRLDATAPLATFGGQAPVFGGADLTFTVTYSDATSGVQYASLGTGDVIVTGPGGYSQVATLVSVDLAGDGMTRVATYSVPAPGGTWDNADVGTYTVAQAAGRVRDVAGNFRASGAVGSFSMGLAPAYVDGSTLVVTLPAPGLARVTRSGGNLVVNVGGTTYAFAFAGLAGVDVNTTSGNDMVQLVGVIPVPVSLVGSEGANTLVLSGSSEVELQGDAAGYAVTVGSGSTLNVGGTQHWTSLLVNGGRVAVAPGAGPLVVGGLSILGGGTLYLGGASMIWDYATGDSPADTLRGYLQSGRGGGTWDGAGGIVPGANVSGSGVGYLEASDLGVSSFAGEAVDASALLVQVAKAGDVNLSGAIDFDDYALADRGMARQVAGAHWLDGDFDYDGIVGPGDYLLLDTSFLVQSGATEPSGAMLAAREAAFGPAYTQALVTAMAAPVTAAPATFSEQPIVESGEPVAPVPVAKIVAPKAVRRNKAVHFKLAEPTAARRATFTYRVDWDGDGVADQTWSGRVAELMVKHAFGTVGKHKVTLWMTDESSGMVSEPVSVWVRAI